MNQLQLTRIIPFSFHYLTLASFVGGGAPACVDTVYVWVQKQGHLGVGCRCGRAGIGCEGFGKW